MLLRLTLAAVLVGTVGTADAAVTCRSGQETLFKRGQTRVFSVDLRDGSGETIYACSARFRTPRHVGDLDFGGDPRFYAGPRFGRRVVLHQFAYSEGGDYGGALGWWDERSGERRAGDLGTALIDRAVIGPDGAMAAVYTDVFEAGETRRVGVLCAGRRRLREVATGDVAPRSLSLTADAARWTTAAGVPVSVPRGC